MWDLIVSVPDHCLSFYFDLITARFFLLPFPFFLIPCDLDLRFRISKRETRQNQTFCKYYLRGKYYHYIPVEKVFVKILSILIQFHVF